MLPAQAAPQYDGLHQGLDGVRLTALCAMGPGSLRWQVQNPKPYDIEFVWWLPGGQASSGSMAVSAGTAVIFESPQEGEFSSQIGALWFDPADNSYKLLTAGSEGILCEEELALVPVTGGEPTADLRQNILQNVGLGLLGIAVLLMGIGIMLDRQAEEA